MSTLYLTRGIQASGKSEWARAWVQEDPGTRVRVNRDDLRRMLYATTTTLLDRQHENVVTTVEQALVMAALTEGKDVVIDAMHLRARYVRRWYALGYPVELVDFPIDLDTALARNATRAHPIPEASVRRTFNQLTPGGVLPPAPVNTGPVVEPYTPNPDLIDTYLVDVDGTLAHMTGRSPYDWDRVGEDDVDEAVRDVVNALSNGARIIVMSGRDSSCREITETWLHANGIEFDQLLMRTRGDNRADVTVKRDLFDEHVRGRFNVLGVFDDRPSVCRMWRALGVKTFQLGDPHKEF